MSAIQKSPLPTPWIPGGPAQTQRANEPGRIIFTRKLWQRTMPDQSEQDVLNRSQSKAQDSLPGSQHSAAGPSRRTSSTVSTRSRRRSLSLSRSSRTPLTPEESPPFRSTRKRTAGTTEEEDKELDISVTTPAHTRTSSGEATVHVCICQPDPKIPRPRNGMHIDSLRMYLQLTLSSFHPVPSAPPSSNRRTEPRISQPRNLKDYW